MSALDWLLGSDPSMRWQALRDLTDAPADEVAAERSKVAKEGWGAQLLARQGADGHWGSDGESPEWVTVQALLLLRDMGLDPDSEQARHAVGLVRDNVRWKGYLPQDAAWHDRPLFDGEVEPCINGRAVTIGAYFGQDVAVIVERLLGEQMADGGWNCEQERGSTRGSFHTTINVLEGLAEHRRATGGSPAQAEAIDRGHQYLLQRRLLRRRSTGELADPAFARFSYPAGYHYDALRGLDHFRATRAVPEPRLDEAITLVRSKQGQDGRWLLENPHPDQIDFDMGERAGRPSRWNTLRALRVLRWHAMGQEGPDSISGA
jgi:hypothetical protein